MKSGYVLLVMAVVAVSGCASVTGTTNQSVSIQTLDKSGAEVKGGVCELSNAKGKWFVTTPGSSMITRSNDDMQIVCSKQGHAPGRASVVSATKGSMFGNIILGGGIGAIIDHNSGAAYEYPSFIQIMMGATSRIDPAAEPVAGQQAGNSAAAAPASLAPPAMPQGGTKEDQLRELKRLHDAGLIDTKLYLDQQRKVLEGT